MDPNSISTTTLAPGIFQGDVILRTGLMACIEDLRRNPYFLQFCFASLAQDQLSKDEYGQKEIDRAVEWFQRTNIWVINSPTKPDNIDFPCVTIFDAGGREKTESTTIGDVNYDTEEPLDLYWPILVGPITPISYDFQTGNVVFSNFNDKILVPGMLLVTFDDKSYPILEVDSDTFTITIAAGTVLNLAGCTIRPVKPSQIVTLKGVENTSNFVFMCHVQGATVHLHYLFSIIKFCLYKYKKQYFEARGFELTKVDWGEFKQNEVFPAEDVYTQSIIVSGVTRDWWPETVYDRIESVITQPRVEGMALPLTEAQLAEQPWIGSENEDPFDDIDSDPTTIIARQRNVGGPRR